MRNLQFAGLLNSVAVAGEKKRSWVRLGRNGGNCRVRLFCLSYAGGRSSVFRDWANLLPSHIDLCPILLPAEQYAEQYEDVCAPKIEELIPPMAAGILPYLNLPFAFFGHSMGATIAFECLCFLEKKYGIRADHLFVSARGAPSVESDFPTLHSLPTKELIAGLERLNGTPLEILADPELLEILLPRIRADLTLIETYRYLSGQRLHCPITAFGGSQDVYVLPEKLSAWKAYSEAEFKLQIFQGDHFFLHSRQEELIGVIAKALPFPSEADG